MIQLSRISFYIYMIPLCAIMLCGHPSYANNVDVTILHTNDFHCTFNRANSLLKTIRSLRKAFPHSILLDAGDMFESKVPKVITSRGRIVVDFMNQAGYDAMTLGDNAFKIFPLEDIERCIKKFRFPVLLSNLEKKSDENPLSLPYFIFNCNGARLGVIGLYDEESLDAAGIKILPPPKTLQRYISLLKNKVDCIIVLSHSGIDKDLKLAGQIDGIDVIVGGSSEVELHNPKKEGDTLIVQAGHYGMYVGALHLSIDTEKNAISKWKGGLIPTSSDLD